MSEKDTITVDKDMRMMLNRLREIYIMDEGHIIRTLLRRALTRHSRGVKL